MVTHNLDKLIDRLNVIEKSLVPQAAEQALKSLGFEIRDLLQKEMMREYKSPSSHTLRSPYFRQEGLTLTIGISDKANNGISPSRYLWPTDSSKGSFNKPTAPTSIDGAILTRFGITDIATPATSSRAGAQLLNAKGALRSRKVQRLLDQLANPGSGRESYFVVKPGESSNLRGGGYRRYRVKSDNSTVFTFTKQTSKPSIDFHSVMIKAAEERLPVLIEQKLRRLLGR